MNVVDQIAKQVEELPPDMQDQMLRFVNSLKASTPAGEHGSNLRRFALSIDAVSVREMSQAIERAD
jgi:hypothetical protein